MRRFSGFGRSVGIGVVAALALVMAGGCGDDDDQSSAPPIAGEYVATVPLEGSDTAEVELLVEENGDADGTVLLPGESSAAVLSGIVPVSVSVQGFADPDTGDFDLGGTFVSGGETITVRLTGVLPAPGRDGSVTLQIGDESFSAPLTAVVVPTPVFTPTSEPNPATPSPTSGGGATPSPTSGTGPTNTPGVIGGVSSDMLGEWSGTARNDTTGTRLDARLRIEVSGGSVVVTDLNGNIFPGSNRVTMEVRTETALTYNAFGPPVVVFTLNLTSPTTLVGLHGVTTPSFPPTTTSLALDLRPAG